MILRKFWTYMEILNLHAFHVYNGSVEHSILVKDKVGSVQLLGKKGMLHAWGQQTCFTKWSTTNNVYHQLKLLLLSTWRQGQSHNII